MNRTIMSAISNFIGFYQQNYTANDVYSKELLTNYPILIHTVSLLNETVYFFFKFLNIIKNKILFRLWT